MQTAYYYNVLSPTHQQIYEQILDGYTKHMTDIAISGKCNITKLKKINEYLLFDHHKLFYVGKKYQFKRHDGITISIHGLANFQISKPFSLPIIYWPYWDIEIFYPSYNYSLSEANKIQKQIDAELNAVLQPIATSVTEIIDKEKAIYEYLVQNTKCNLKEGEIEHTNYSIVGPFLKKLAVCEGYAKAFKYLCDVINFFCIVVCGIGLIGSSEEHAWNIVKIGRAYYHVDVTWDISQNNKPFKYFNISDKEMSMDHKWDKQMYPTCEADLK